MYKKKMKVNDGRLKNVWGIVFTIENLNLIVRWKYI